MSTSPPPKVTIITPAYNRAGYLEETIKSILQQGYPNLEYIVLDDGSTDNTVEILKQYEGRIRWESHANMGETLTVNKGFQMASGEYFCVVNSDDLLLPGAIQQAVDMLKAHPDVLVVYPDWTYIDEKSSPTHVVHVPEHDYRYMVGQHKCYVGPAAFFRRNAIALTGGRNPGFRYVADFDFWLRLGLHGEFKRIPQVLGTFRVHSGSASVRQKASIAKEDIRLIQSYYQTTNLPPEILRIKRQAFSSAHLHAAFTCEPDHLAALRHYLRFLLYDPANLLRADLSPLRWWYLRQPLARFKRWLTSPQAGKEVQK